ncbi:MAG TPA: hypothetical protein VFY29_12680 [Terriglobia bacterium]|nr:hypothetical protein [Terriglobia bacterium]
MSKHLLTTILAVVCLMAAAACGAAVEPSETAPAQQAAAQTPKITISTTKLVHPEHLEMRGSGFSPKHNAKSHLKRADGTEFPVLNILTDEHGEFVHDVDSLLLMVGTHELWVFDETTGAQSNVARFEVVRE